MMFGIYFKVTLGFWAINDASEQELGALAFTGFTMHGGFEFTKKDEAPAAIPPKTRSMLAITPNSLRYPDVERLPRDSIFRSMSNPLTTNMIPIKRTKMGTARAFAAK